MIFFLVVFTVLILVNLYIFYRTRNLFPVEQPLRWGVIVLFWVVALGYMAGRILERTGAGGVAEVVIKFGSIWLGAMVYLTLIFLLVDMLRGVSHIPGLKGFFSFPWASEKGRWFTVGVYGVTALILVAGFFNARNPKVVRQPVVLDKVVPGGTYKALLVSDIHLGIMISNGRLERLVELINRQNADVILMAGDIFDEDLGPVIRNNLGDLLKNLRAKEGVFAILGNHEFYGNAPAAEKYLRDHHISVLRDSAVTLPSGMTLIGREEITNRQMSGQERQSLASLLAVTDPAKPVIVMDHQPYRLSEVAKNPVDLQVSGHTHHGQMWPFNHITNAIFEISAGYGKIANTHFYVSPGVGTWGPPIRTSGRPEVIVLEISGK